jgi:hypothetical protein
MSRGSITPNREPVIPARIRFLQEYLGSPFEITDTKLDTSYPSWGHHQPQSLFSRLLFYGRTCAGATAHDDTNFLCENQYLDDNVKYGPVHP